MAVQGVLLWAASVLVAIAGLMLALKQYRLKTRAQLYIHKAASVETTGGTKAVPRGDVSLLVRNGGSADALNVCGRFRSSWVTGWTALRDLPAVVPPGRSVSIPLPAIPRAYTERQRDLDKADVWFELELTHGNPDGTSFSTTVRQRYPTDTDRLCWDIDEPQKSKCIGKRKR